MVVWQQPWKLHQERGGDGGLAGRRRSTEETEGDGARHSAGMRMPLPGQTQGVGALRPEGQRGEAWHGRSEHILSIIEKGRLLLGGSLHTATLVFEKDAGQKAISQKIVHQKKKSNCPSIKGVCHTTAEFLLQQDYFGLFRGG